MTECKTIVVHTTKLTKSCMASVIPSTKGCSGPTITNVIELSFANEANFSISFEAIATLEQRPGSSEAVPTLPGATNTLVIERDSFDESK